jgi:hypothetical protein
MCKDLKIGTFWLLLVFVATSFVRPPNEVLTKAAFIERYLPLAREVNRVYGIPVSVCLGQSLLEAKAGNSSLALDARNFFGMKCKEPGEIGHMVWDDEDTASCFRIYEDAKASFMDYGHRVTTNGMYARVQALKTNDEKDPAKWLKAIADSGYASDTSYFQKVSRIIKDQNLTKYDQIGPAHYEHDVNETENTPTAVVESGSDSDLNSDTEDLDAIADAFADSVTVQSIRPFATEPAYEIPTMTRIPAPVFERPFQETEGLQIYPSPPLVHPVRLRKQRFDSGVSIIR